MKKIHALTLGLLLTLSACGGGQKITADMTIRAKDAATTMSLIKSAENVLIRRLAAADIKNAHVSAIPTNSNAGTLTVTSSDSTALERAKSILEEPFSFDIRIEKPKTETGSGTLKTSDWIPTALTGASLVWVQPIGNKATGEISIALQFTKEGEKILSQVFRGNVGKDVGIFVRDLLVSKLKVTSAAVSDRVVIGGIPSAKVAEIFADDVNVGLFVDFHSIQ